MKFFKKAILLMVFIFYFLLLFTFDSVVIANNTVKLDYVALGDSLAAGVTPNNTIGKSYTDFIEEKLDGEGMLGDYKNFGVPGYKAADILRIIDPNSSQNADRVLAIKKAQIITLDIGANDLLGSISTLLEDPSKAPSTLKCVVLNVAEIISTLKKINPNVKIYLMGYYNAFASYPKGQQEELLSLIKEFNSDLREAAGGTGATYVDTYSIMEQHLKEYLPKENIHPDILGYQVIANEFWNIIKVDFPKVMS